MRSMIERVRVDRYFPRQMDWWKQLRPEWDVTALVAPDRQTVVFLAYREDDAVQRPEETKRGVETLAEKLDA